VHYLHERSGTRLPIGVLLSHALSCGAVLTLVLLSPHLLLKVKPGGAAIAVSVAAGLAICALAAISIHRRGIAIAPAVTLVPLIIAIGFVVKVAAPVVDSTQSARPVAQAVSRVRPTDYPVVVFHVPRQTEYGLPYYGIPVTVLDDATRDRLLPPPPYLLITSEKAATEFATSSPMLPVGQFVPQRLLFFIVSRSPQGQ
jgi:hypothetical protein